MKRFVTIFLAGCLISLPALPAPPSSTEDRSGLEQEYLRRGEDHFFARRFGTSLQWFRKALEINPDNARAHAFTGDILLSLDDPDQALRHFQIAAELETDPSPELFRMGQIYYLKRDRVRSEEYFLRALEKNPELAEAHFYLGLLAFHKKKNRVETLKHLKLFREKRPDFRGRKELDRVIALLESSETSADESRELIHVDPLGLFFRRASRPEQKNVEGPPGPDRQRLQNEDDLRKGDALKKEDAPKQEGTSGDKTEITEEQADTEKTARTEANPPSPGSHFIPLPRPNGGALQKAMIYRDDDPEKALAFLAKAREKAPSDGRLASLSCEIYLEKKQTKEALDACRDAARISPDFRNLQNLGVVYEIIGDPANAFDACDRALEKRLEPDLAIRTARLGKDLPPPGRLPRVRGLIERLLARHPTHRDGLILLLQLQDKENDVLGLRATGERLLALYPDDLPALREIVGVFLSHEETEKQALPLLRRYCAKAPDDIIGGLTLARLYMKLGREEEAMAVLGDLNKKAPGNEDVTREILTIFLRENRNLDSAETVARGFFENNPNAEARERIARMLPETLRAKVLPPPDVAKPPAPDAAPDDSQQPPK